MTCQILTEEEARGNGCQFEEWDKAKKQMCNCGKLPIATVGKSFLCIDHLADALVRCGCGAYLEQATGNKNVHPRCYEFKEDFLKHAKEVAAERSAK